MQIEGIRAHLAALVGEERLLVDSASLASHGHDFWLLDLQKRLHGAAMPVPACVVQPETVAEVSAILAFANREGIPVVPYGAGSGVCGGSKPPEGAIVLDTRRMSRVLDVNETALTVTAQPGMLGKDLEAELNFRGYSMGHFPQSMNISSVGGWVATRASGQFSTRYGSIEDMLVCLKAVLADGTVIETKDVPRSSTGPSLNELLLGSEGTLAVIVELTFKIHPLPEAQRMRAFQFARFSDGLEAIRKITRAGWKPPLVRLYDAEETKRHFGDHADRGSCFLLVLSEGPARLADVELEACTEICAAEGGLDRGDEPVKHWLENRFRIPDLNELAGKKGVIFDTIEVAANWDRVGRLYEAVIAALRTVPGIAAASAHSSHSYQQGTCLYFTFAVKKPYWLVKQVAQRVSPFAWGRFDNPRHAEIVERTYNECWGKVMEATLANGGTIAHHHGVGKVRLPWIERELPTGYRILERVKRALDPRGILNPGTFFRQNRP
jgi:alkyldihydroxyacetonephosphate synthase